MVHEEGEVGCIEGMGHACRWRTQSNISRGVEFFPVPKPFNAYFTVKLWSYSTTGK